MHQHVEALTQVRTQAKAGVAPSCLEGSIRHIDIGDGQVVPLHAARLAGIADAIGLHGVQFIHRHQCHDGGSTPTADGIQVDIHVALPMTGEGVPLLLAWANGKAHGAQARPHGHLAQMQGAAATVEDAGGCHEESLNEV